jgi:hypothetical protein
VIVCAYPSRDGGGALSYRRGMNEPPWRVDRDLATRFHPEYPDDLQVTIHDGEPRRTKRQVEVCWVRATGVPYVIRYNVATLDAPIPLEDLTGTRFVLRRVYSGVLLNQPHQLLSARAGEQVLFTHAPGQPHPLRVTPEYLSERVRWSFVPCTKCGQEHALDPMSVMIQTRFPDAPKDHVHQSFTSFCPCGGSMVLIRLPANGEGMFVANSGDPPPR